MQDGRKFAILMLQVEDKNSWGCTLRKNKQGRCSIEANHYCRNSHTKFILAIIKPLEEENIYTRQELTAFCTDPEIDRNRAYDHLVIFEDENLTDRTILPIEIIMKLLEWCVKN